MRAVAFLLVLLSGLAIGFFLGRGYPSAAAVQRALDDMDAAEVAALAASLERRWGVSAAQPPRASVLLPRSTGPDAGTEPLIEAPTDLEPFVGKIVRVRGVVDNTKIPNLLGLSLPGQDALRRRAVLVRGTVLRTEITQEQIDEANAIAGPIASTGPGVFYSLESVEVLKNETGDAR